MNKKPLNVYIGYDGWSSQAAYDVCEHTLLKTASIPLNIICLDLDWLRRIGLYTRTFYEVDEQRYDAIDGKPFSTDFSFSRFLVPMLQPEGWAVFCDQDFLWRADIAELIALADDNMPALCVHHKHAPTEESKMDGQKQTIYGRKNWSSLTLWNCAHPANERLSVRDVNTRPGQWLHGMRWLRDDEIGTLPVNWNWLDGSSDLMIEPAAVHFTRGTPDMRGWRDTRYANEWLDAWGELSGDHELQYA